MSTVRRHDNIMDCSNEAVLHQMAYQLYEDHMELLHLARDEAVQLMLLPRQRVTHLWMVLVTDILRLLHQVNIPFLQLYSIM